MFTLKNKFGNLIQKAETVREKEKLESLGYTVISATTDSSKHESKAEKAKTKKFN